MNAFSNITREIEKQGTALSMIEISSVRSWADAEGEPGYCSLLSTRELACLNSMRVKKRRLDFLSGRIAGKHAVKRLLAARNGVRPDTGTGELRLSDIEIRRTVTGAPRVFINDSPEMVRVSISHSPRFAVSAVCSGEEYRGIGIDIEKIERRDESILAVAFRMQEIKAMRERADKDGKSLDDCITHYWSLKEAALKSMGIGLNVDLKDIEIVEEPGGGVRLAIENEVRDRLHELRSSGVEAKSYLLDGHVLSVAYLN
jgi:phosphopantetheine--protein transferase-like protein